MEPTDAILHSRSRGPSWLTEPSWSRDLSLLAIAVLGLYSVISLHPPIGSAIRYAESAREMAHSGDWVVPTLDFVPYFEKPILIYWLGALAQSWLGSSGFAVQLPSCLAALISVFATYALGRHWRSPGFGVLAALLLLFSGQFLVFTSVLTTDALFSAWLALAWYAFWRHDRTRTWTWMSGATPQQGWIWLFWVAIGLAFLTKGPLAVVLAGCAVGGYLFLKGGFRGLWSDGWHLGPVQGLAVVVLINLPWNLLAWQRDPRFLDFFYWRINFRAFFDGSVNHPGPPYYYLPVLAAALAPWTFIALPALAQALWHALVPATTSRLMQWLGAGDGTEWKASAPSLAARLRGWGYDPLNEEAESDRDRRLGRLYLASVVFFPLLFLSLSASKLGTYLMPVYGAIALLVVDRLDALAARPPGWLRWGMLVQAALLIIAGAVYGLALVHADDLKQIDWTWLPVLILGVGCLVGGMMWGGFELARRRLVRGMTVCGLGLAAAVAICLPNAFHMLKYIDGRALAHLAARYAGPDDRLFLTQPCVHDHSIVWELDRPLYFLGHPRELGMGLYTSATPKGTPWPRDAQTHKERDCYELRREDAPAQERLYTDAQLQQEWSGARRFWLFGHSDWIKPLIAAGLPVYEVARTDKITLVTNQPLDGVTGTRLSEYRHGLP